MMEALLFICAPVFGAPASWCSFLNVRDLSESHPTLVVIPH